MTQTHCGDNKQAAGSCSNCELSCEAANNTNYTKSLCTEISYRDQNGYFVAAGKCVYLFTFKTEYLHMEDYGN